MKKYTLKDVITTVIAFVIFSTSCGGDKTPATASWKSISVGSSDAHSKIVFANDQTGYFIGFNGSLFKTEDGENWTKQILNDELLELNVFSPTSVFVIGTHKIFKSTDGGAHWTDQVYSQAQSLEAIHFVTELVGFRGLDPDIYKSTDGGSTWNKILSVGGPALIDFSSSSLGHIYSPGKVYETADGGTTWGEKTWNIGIPAGSILTDILFINPLLGFVLDHSGGIYKTTDGGLTWSSKSTGITSGLRNVAFFDGDFGFAVGDNGVILSTTNGGEAWSRMNTTTTKLINSIAFQTKDKACAVGFGGIVLKYQP